MKKGIRGYLRGRKAVSKLILFGVPVIVVIVSITIVAIAFRLIPFNVSPSASDYEISANPSSISIPRGSSGDISITVKSVNGFNSLVEFLGVPSKDIRYYISTFCPPVAPPLNGQVTTTLTISVDLDAPPGTYYLDWSAKSDTPPLDHTVRLYFAVTE